MGIKPECDWGYWLRHSAPRGLRYLITVPHYSNRGCKSASLRSWLAKCATDVLKSSSQTETYQTLENLSTLSKAHLHNYVHSISKGNGKYFTQSLKSAPH